MPPARTAIISDIHGHYSGLLAVMRDIEQSNCARVLCLGDLVEGGEESDSVVRYVRDHYIPAVIGNHDETNDLVLADDVRAYIERLPESLIEGDVIYTHISPRAKKAKINDPFEAWNVFEETQYRLIFVGHAHVPLLFGAKSAHFGEAMSYETVYHQPYPLNPEDRYIICVGAIGYSRDGMKKPRYCIYDQALNTVEMRVGDYPTLALG